MWAHQQAQLSPPLAAVVFETSTMVGISTCSSSLSVCTAMAVVRFRQAAVRSSCLGCVSARATQVNGWLTRAGRDLSMAFFSA